MRAVSETRHWAKIADTRQKRVGCDTRIEQLFVVMYWNMHARHPIRKIARQIAPANFNQATEKYRTRALEKHLCRIATYYFAADRAGFFTDGVVPTVILLAECPDSFCQGWDFFEFCWSSQLFTGHIARCIFSLLTCQLLNLLVVLCPDCAWTTQTMS